VGSSIKRPVCHPPPSNRKKNQNPQTQPRRLRHPAPRQPMGHPPIRFLGAIFGQARQPRKTTPKNTRITTQSKSNQIPCIPALYASHFPGTRNVPVFHSPFEKLPEESKPPDATPASGHPARFDQPRSECMNVFQPIWEERANVSGFHASTLISESNSV
jgi:hypothetical protein